MPCSGNNDKEKMPFFSTDAMHFQIPTQMPRSVQVPFFFKYFNPQSVVPQTWNLWIQTADSVTNCRQKATEIYCLTRSGG